MRCTTLLIAMWSAAAGALLASDAALAHRSDGRAPTAQPCAPTGEDTTGRSRDLSDKLAESKGVICPPPSGDREIQVKPPAGGELKIIPPPGSPGGDQSVQPK